MIKCLDCGKIISVSKHPKGRCTGCSNKHRSIKSYPQKKNDVSYVTSGKKAKRIRREVIQKYFPVHSNVVM